MNPPTPRNPGKPKFFDSHNHLNDPAFEGELELVVARAFEAGVKGFLVVGYNLESSRRAVELAETLPWTFAAVGLHPHEARVFSDDLLSELRALAQHERVVAIGEIGLDYHYHHSTPEEQKRALRAQLDLARGLDLPVSLHIRKAFPDMFEELAAFRGVAGVFHCFSGGPREARQALEMGFYISYSGFLTYGSRKLEKALRQTPLDRLLIETDAPYLAPGEYKGGRNEPAYLPITARKVAEVLEMPLDQVARATYENARRLFRLPIPPYEEPEEEDLSWNEENEEEAL